MGTSGLADVLLAFSEGLVETARAKQRESADI